MVDVKPEPADDAFGLYDDLDAPPLTVPATPDEVKPALPPSPRGGASGRKASGSPSVSRKASTSKPATPSGNGGGTPDEEDVKPLSVAHLPEATKEVRKRSERA